jgi:hypothetical protein
MEVCIRSIFPNTRCKMRLIQQFTVRSHLLLHTSMNGLSHASDIQSLELSVTVLPNYRSTKPFNASDH